MATPQAELIDYWVALAREKGIEKEESTINGKGKVSNPYRIHAVWFGKLLSACGKDLGRAKRALEFYFADKHPAVATYGWSIGVFSKRYLGYVAKVKEDDEMKARLARRWTEDAVERRERGTLMPPPQVVPKEVLEKTEALKRKWGMK